MFAVSMLFTVRALPRELMLRRQRDFMLAAIVYIDKCVLFDPPFERFDIRGRLADLKDHVQERTAGVEAAEEGVLVETVERCEVGDKVLFAEHRINRIRAKLKAIQPIDCKDIGYMELGFQPELDIETEEKSLFQGNEIARDAVVFGRDPLGGQQLGFDVPKNCGSIAIERIESLTKVFGGAAQSLAQQFVSATSEFTR